MPDDIVADKPTVRKRVNLVGCRFGRLVALSELPSRRQQSGQLARYFSCVCDCGNKVQVHYGNLRSGHTRSCGCIHDENSRTVNITHGHSRTPTFHVWRAMRSRCCNPKDKNYRNYGGRGIRVCIGWRTSFAAFLRDMGEQPSGLWIDRVDTNGNYSCGHCPECLSNGWPLNCRWATPTVQNNNRRNNVHITYQGQTKTLSEWARKAGITPCALRKRLFVSKWPIERAMNHTPRKSRTYKGTSV